MGMYDSTRRPAVRRRGKDVGGFAGKAKDALDLASKAAGLVPTVTNAIGTLAKLFGAQAGCHESNRWQTQGFICHLTRRKRSNSQNHLDFFTIIVTN